MSSISSGRRALCTLGLSLLVVAGSFAGGWVYQSFLHARAGADTPGPVTPPRTATEIERALIAAAGSAQPAVVSIATEHTVHVPGFRHPFADDPFFRQFFGGRFQVPDEDREVSGLGSGFVVTTEGRVVTNAHVVAPPEVAPSAPTKITVRFSDGREREACVLGIDKATDIALLEIIRPEDRRGETFPVVPLGDSDDLEIGQIVLAIGTPFDRRLSQSVSMGIVSGKGRSGLGIEDLEDFIQTDAAINPGNSGGPLIDLSGRVVGMNTAISTRSGGSAGVGFPIPSSLIRSVLAALSEGKPVRRGYLGVTVQDLTEEMARELGVGGTAGAVVGKILPSSPAERAGLAEGDVIVRWNDREIRAARDLTAAVTATPVGSKARVVWRRGAEERSAEVEVAERPVASEAEESSEARGPGAEVKGLKIRVRESADGLVIAEIASGSPLEGKAEVGAVILAVSRTPVRTVAALEEALRGKSRVLLHLRQGNAQVYLLVPVGSE